MLERSTAPIALVLILLASLAAAPGASAAGRCGAHP